MDVPIHGSPVRSDIVENPGPPRVQFGNDGEKHWGTDSGLRPGRRGFVRVDHDLDLPRRAGFSVHVPEPDADRGQGLMTPEAIEIMGRLGRSFDVEVFGGSLWAYSNYGAITTEDDDVWGWAYSVASRLLDLASLWGADPRLRQAWPDYTRERLERPERLDGALSFIRRPRR